MTDEEDDWFERALRELDEGEGDTASERPDDGLAGDRAAEGEAAESDAAGDDAADESHDDAANGETVDGHTDIAADRSGQDGQANETGDTLDGGPSETDDPFGGGGGSGSGSFGENDPFGGGGGSGSGSFGENDPFGGGGGSGSGSFGENDPFGGGGGGSFGGAPDDGPTAFEEDPEELDSDIDRTNIGIEGLDEMILGGVPSRSLLSVIGGAGTGKTTFALQFLNEALESDRRAVYITLEQTRESILATAEEKGWAFREHADAGRLAVVALDPIEMANSLASIRNDLSRLIESFGADRLVLDSVSLLEMMYDHPAKRRSEVFGFTRSLKQAGVTTLLTSEASSETPYASRYGIVEYLTDAVFVLQYVRGSDFRETRLAVEIQKIRDANHSRETKPYEITNSGISVYRQANIF